MTRAYAELDAEIMRRVTVDSDGCWIVAARDNGSGYQWLFRDYAHRHMHRIHVGPIPAGYEVDHLCVQPACANPAHLEAVTPQENKRREFARKRSCIRGHPLPEFEVGINRPCSPCHAIRQAKRARRIAAGESLPVTVQDHQHGTRTAYNYGCRCDRCKNANRLYRQRRRAQIKAGDGTAIRLWHAAPVKAAS